jgi:hypothetical protein
MNLASRVPAHAPDFHERLAEAVAEDQRYAILLAGVIAASRHHLKWEVADAARGVLWEMHMRVRVDHRLCRIDDPLSLFSHTEKYDAA